MYAIEYFIMPGFTFGVKSVTQQAKQKKIRGALWVIDFQLRSKHTKCQ